MEDEIIDSTVEEVSPEVVENEPKSMDDTIRETLEAINSRGEPEESEEQKADRVRDDKGRFASKEQPEEVVETPETVEPEAPAVVPPELQKLGLRKEEAEALQANPVALQAFMRRSEEMHKGLEQYRSKAQFGDSIATALQPFQQTLQQINVHPAEAITRLFTAEHTLRNGSPDQRQRMFLKLAQDYQVDLGQVQEQLANQPYVEPQVQSLQSE